MEDDTIDRLARYAEFLPPDVRVCFPENPALFTHLSDKSTGIREARRRGWAHPESWIPVDGEWPKEDGRYMVKPIFGGGSRGVRRFHSLKALNLWRDLQPLDRIGDIVVQRHRPELGAGYGASVVLGRDGSFLGGCAHVRHREYPTSGGPSTLRETVDRPDLLEKAVTLFRDAGWWGPGMLEFKGDHFIEINPRFWGSVHLAHRADCPVAELAVRAALGEEVKAPKVARPGVTARWYWPGDLLHGMKSDDLPDSFAWMPESDGSCDVVDRRDPGPMVGTLLWAVTMLGDPVGRKLLLGREIRVPGVGGQVPAGSASDSAC
jgi:hypothetical protein